MMNVLILIGTQLCMVLGGFVLGMLTRDIQENNRKMKALKNIKSLLDVMIDDIERSIATQKAFEAVKTAKKTTKKVISSKKK